MNECQIPPVGWWCSREPGHDGPCAARQSVAAELTDEEFEEALAEIRRLWNAEPGSPDGYALEDLARRVNAYEKKRWPIEPPCIICEHELCQCRVCRQCGWIEGTPRPGLSCAPLEHTFVSKGVRTSMGDGPTDKTKPWLHADHPEAIACQKEARVLDEQLRESSVDVISVGVTTTLSGQHAAITVSVEHPADVRNVPSFFNGYNVYCRVTGKLKPL